MDTRQAVLMREQFMQRGALEQYAHAPPEKPKLRFPWGILIGLIILILVYYFMTNLVFG